MEKYYNAIICKNGHVISAIGDNTDKFCKICGSETITACTQCQTPIRGKICNDMLLIGINYELPAYCYKCGAPFPWTVSALDAAKEIINFDSAIPDNEKEMVIHSIPDIISETPKSNIAAIRFKKVMSCAGKFTADALRQFIIDFGCELVKNQIGI